MDSLKKFIEEKYIQLNLSLYDLYDEYIRIQNINEDELNHEFESDAKNIRKIILQDIQSIINNKINEESTSIHKEIDDYRKDFEYYPDVYDDNFIEILSKKKEFWIHRYKEDMKSIDTKCNRDYFELAPHQMFLKNYISHISPYRSLLIFHGVGVGKTCSGITIAENFKDIYASKEKRIIILAKELIQIGWKKNIYDPNKSDNQCTGTTYASSDTFSEDVSRRSPSEKRTKKKINTYYELHPYASFANSVKRYLTKNLQHIDPSNIDEYTQKESQLIKEKYSNRVLIIDEVHNVRANTSSPTQDRDTLIYLEKVIEYSHNLKLILLTANPMYNLSTEIVWILNLLLL